ncbi:MAG: glycosyltransferase [Bacteroidia bacterium]
MKIALINATDFGSGAANACYRLMASLNSAGASAKMIVQKQKGPPHPHIIPILKKRWQKFPYLLRHLGQKQALKPYQVERAHGFSLSSGNPSLMNHPFLKEADIINLHFPNDFFVSVAQIKKLSELKKPFFITLHDMWLFTGGCHYSMGCDKYVAHCKSCPALNSSIEKDLSYRLFEKKLNYFEHLSCHIITPSQWLQSRALESRLFSDTPVSLARYGLDLSLFKSESKEECQRYFNIEPDENKVDILFGGVNSVDDKRKGIEYLLDALEEVIRTRPELSKKIRLLIFGVESADLKLASTLEIKFLGKIYDEKLIPKCYNACDIFILPSLEDNLPNTIIEAMACGIPIIAFDVGGIPEMIVDRITGHLVKPRDKIDLAVKIISLTENSARKQMGEKAREKATNMFSYEKCASSHLSLFQKALDAFQKSSL